MTVHVVDRLSAYLDQELSVTEAASVREHLAGCEACAERLAHLAAVDVGVRDLPVDAPAEYFDSFASRVRTRIETAARPRTRFRVPVWSWAVAAAVLVAVILPRMPVGSVAPTALTAKEEGSSAPAAALEAPMARTDAPAPARAAAPASLRDQDGRSLSPEAEARAKKNELATGGAASEDGQRQIAAAPPTVAGAPPSAPFADRARVAQAPGFSAAPPPVQAPAPAARPPARAEALTAGKADAYAEGALREDDAAARDELKTQAAGVAPSELAKDKRRDEDASGAKPQAAAAPAAGQTEEPLKLRRGAAAEKVAPAPRGSATAEFHDLEARDAGTPLREQRDGWRAFALRHPDDPRADEARVRVVALGVSLARQTGDEGDRAQAQSDGAGYLTRKDASQKGRVRALLEDLAR